MSKNKLSFNNPFCPLPFIHQHVNTNKQSRLCCFSLDDDYVSNKMNFNSDSYKSVRDNIIQNKWSKECTVCKIKEEQKLISPRQNAVRDLYLKYANLIDNQIELHTSGQNLKPYYYDLRISNLCNLTCQMCNEESSSSIAKKLNKTNVFLSYEPNIDINPNSIKMYIAGGEPFMIKKFVDILNKIDNLDCEIVVNTNGTVINDKFLIALKRFKNVNITLSLDGFGELNSRIRTGSQWDQIVSNLQLFKECGFSIHVNTVVQKDNINELYELGFFLDENKVDRWTWCELIEPTEFEWKHAKLDVEKIKKNLLLKIVKKNLELSTLINKIIK